VDQPGDQFVLGILFSGHDQFRRLGQDLLWHQPSHQGFGGDNENKTGGGIQELIEGGNTGGRALLVRRERGIGRDFIAGAGENTDAGEQAQILFQNADLMLIGDDAAAVFLGGEQADEQGGTTAP